MVSPVIWTLSFSLLLRLDLREILSLGGGGCMQGNEDDKIYVHVSFQLYDPFPSEIAWLSRYSFFCIQGTRPTLMSKDVVEMLRTLCSGTHRLSRLFFFGSPKLPETENWPTSKHLL